MAEMCRCCRACLMAGHLQSLYKLVCILIYEFMRNVVDRLAPSSNVVTANSDIK